MAIQRFDEAESDYATCLDGAGFEYLRRQVKVEVATTSGGLLTRTEAMRRSGYGIVSGDGYRGAVASVTGGHFASSDSAGIERASADNGVCAGAINAIDVQLEIQQLVGDFDRLPDSLPSDPRFLAAMSEWRACMDDRGFPFDSPVAAFRYVESEFAALSEPVTADALDALGAEERRIATADGECFDENVNEIVATIIEESPP